MANDRSAAERPSTARIWLMAIRPPTLTAAVAPVVVGTAVAMRDDVFHLGGGERGATGRNRTADRGEPRERRVGLPPRRRQR